MYVCVCMCIYVCVYVYLYVHMYECFYFCMYVCKYVCTYVHVSLPEAQFLTNLQQQCHIKLHASVFSLLT